MLKLENVQSGYGEIKVLKDVSLEVKEGEIVTLIGANGAGKTTTLMTISGLNPLRQGAIFFEKQRVDHLPAHQIVRCGIIQVPEGRRIFSQLTVLENLQMGGYLREKTDAPVDLEKVFSIFPVLKERCYQKAGTLSGGEQQMLALGRALMGRPRLLLLDEPSLGLAPILVQKIFEIIRELNRQGVTILLVEQDAYLALKLAHRGYVMETGRITLSDTGLNLLNNPQVKKAYLGES